MKAPMEIEWAAWYRPDWDEQPERYVEEGVVELGAQQATLPQARDAHPRYKSLFIGVQQ